MRARYDRRGFLRRGAGITAGAVVLGGGGSALLTACGSSSSGSSSSPSSAASPGSGSKDLGTLDYRLSWIKNVEFGGAYEADSKGYYKAAGFSSVNLIAGGPTANLAETDVTTGKALVGITAPDVASAAILKGAPVILIGAQYQQNPFCVMSLASKPIRTPEQMYGKKIGVQAANESVWTAFLKANKLDPAKIKKIPVQFDPTPLVKGEVDGWFSFVTNEPNLLKAKGIDTATFKLADFNYPLVSETYVVRKDSLTKERARLKAMFVGDIKGWKDAVAKPAEVAALTVSTYGKGLGLTAAEQTLEATSQVPLIENADTKKNGFFTITPELIEENIKTLAFAGITITADKLFDMSVIEEVYKENPGLV